MTNSIRAPQLAFARITFKGEFFHTSATGAAAFYHQIEQNQFDDDNSSDLRRTYSGNRTNFGVLLWLKRVDIRFFK